MPKDGDDATIFVETAAGKVCCRERKGEGASLLLLHGSGFSSDIFGSLMEQPSLDCARLVAMDLPGHGRSDDARDAAATYSIPGFSAVVREVMASLQLSPCIVVGWSLGGDIAMNLLEDDTAISGVVLVGAPPVPAGLLGKLRGHRLTGANLACKATFTPSQALRFEKLCLGRMSDGRFVPALLRTDRRMRPHLARSALLSRGQDQRKAVLSTKLPVWLVVGQEDTLVRIRYVRALGERFVPAKSVWIAEGAGHAPFFDDPAGFAGRLADFAGAASEGYRSRCYGREDGAATSPFVATDGKTSSAGSF